MSVFKGFVKKINSKTGRGSRGPWTAWSMRLEDDNGVEIDKWFSLGFDKPEIKEGEYIKITVEQDGKYEKVTEIKALKNAPAKSNKEAAQGTSTYVNGTQKSIHYQSSRKDAIEAIKILLANDGLPLSTAKNKGGQAKRYEELMALIDKLTIRYFYDAETQRLLNTVVDEGKIDTDVGNLPEDSDDDEDTQADEAEDNDEDDDE